jgi:hypothetical protein
LLSKITDFYFIEIKKIYGNKKTRPFLIGFLI